MSHPPLGQRPIPLPRGPVRAWTLGLAALLTAGPLAAQELGPRALQNAPIGVNFAVVGLLDSDGDGRTNNQGINLDCTNPADATAPGETFTWSSVKALFD